MPEIEEFALTGQTPKFEVGDRVGMIDLLGHDGVKELGCFIDVAELLLDDFGALEGEIEPLELDVSTALLG